MEYYFSIQIVILVHYLFLFSFRKCRTFVKFLFLAAWVPFGDFLSFSVLATALSLGQEVRVIFPTELKAAVKTWLRLYLFPLFF